MDIKYIDKYKKVYKYLIAHFVTHVNLIEQTRDVSIKELSKVRQSSFAPSFATVVTIPQLLRLFATFATFRLS